MPTFSILTSAFGLKGLRKISYNKSSGQEISSEVSGYYPPAPTVKSEVSGYSTPVKTGNFNLNSGVLGSSKTTYMGTPVVSDLVLESTDVQFANTLKFELQTVLLTVSQAKIIKRTAIDGRAGTIKEYVSDDDYEVKIQGAIVNPAGSFPTEDVRKLRAILLKPKAIKAISDYLLLFNIYDIVISGYSFGQKEGYQNLQFFEITAYSDTPENIVFDAKTK